MESSVMAEILTAMTSKSENASSVPINNLKQENAVKEKEEKEEIDIYSEEYPPKQYVWRIIFAFVFLHSTTLYAGYLFAFGHIMWQTFVYSVILLYTGSFGVTGGSHRLWSHKSYRARFPLRVFLMLAQTMALQNSIWEWSRDHRVHHKFTETHADPHNAKRGFFFAHMGWLTIRKHPAVTIKGKTVDMSDLEKDPVVMFQHKYYLIMAPLFCFVIPALIPWYFWGETAIGSFCFAAVLRYTISLHLTWTINSIAHMFGDKPYDKNIGPVESDWGWFTTGEGWHNYHHTFPWDYKAAEIGGFAHNATAFFIDQFAKIGWAYDLKTVPQRMIEQRIKRTGDGTHEISQGVHGHEITKRAPCAWGDVDIPPESVLVTKTLYPKKEN